MNIRRFIFISTIVALIAFLGSCKKEDPIIEVTSVSISQSSLSIARGGNTRLTATVSPSNATDKTVNWSSSNTSVATVDNGNVNASGKTASCEVTVTPKGIASIKLDKDAASMSVKEVLTLTATIEPSDADDKTVTWTSSDESVAKVENGKITAIGKGAATITASAGSLKVTCKVTVSYPVKSITLNKTTAQIEEDATLTLKATVDTEDPDVKVEWTSDDSNIATVDDKGIVKGIVIGETTITAKFGDKTATCKVTVKEGTYKAKERGSMTRISEARYRRK